jgi:hypothetical protein
MNFSEFTDTDGHDSDIARGMKELAQNTPQYPRRCGYQFMMTALCVLIVCTLCHAGSTAQERPQTLQQFIDLEMDLTQKSLHPKKMLIIVLDTERGEFSGLGGMLGRHRVSKQRIPNFAATLHYDPSATLDDFSDEILLRAGVNRRSATPMQIVELYRAVGNGGRYRASTNATQLMSGPESQHLRRILEQQVMQGDGLLLARVHGLHIAGCAAHSRNTSEAKATSAFVGFYPARKPRNVCLVLVEAPKVLPKYNRGALVAAPIFSRVAGFGHQ